MITVTNNISLKVTAYFVELDLFSVEFPAKEGKTGHETRGKYFVDLGAIANNAEGGG